MKASMFTWRATRLERERTKAPSKAKKIKSGKLFSLPRANPRAIPNYHLGQGEINEDDPTFQDVNAEIGVDGDQQQARQERKEEKIEGFHGLFLSITIQTSEV